MIKPIIWRILESQVLATILIKPVLKMHSASYKLASIMSIKLNNNIHPKHEIMQYKAWFMKHIGEGSVVLDVGCNTGIMALAMSNKAKFVYGVEISCKHIDIAKELRDSENIEYICADATVYDYSQCLPVNVITLSNVLEHIEDRVSFLRELIFQVPWSDKNNRRLLIRVPMIDREWIAIYKKELGLEYRLDNTHFVEYTYKQFEREMSQSGVKVLSHHIRFGEIYAICEAY